MSENAETAIASAEFELQFNITNLRHLLGADPPDREKIDQCHARITACEKKIKMLKQNDT